MPQFSTWKQLQEAVESCIDQYPALDLWINRTTIIALPPLCSVLPSSTSNGDDNNEHDENHVHTYTPKYKVLLLWQKYRHVVT